MERWCHVACWLDSATCSHLEGPALSPSLVPGRLRSGKLTKRSPNAPFAEWALAAPSPDSPCQLSGAWFKSLPGAWFKTLLLILRVKRPPAPPGLRLSLPDSSFQLAQLVHLDVGMLKAQESATPMCNGSSFSPALLLSGAFPATPTPLTPAQQPPPRPCPAPPITSTGGGAGPSGNDLPVFLSWGCGPIPFLVSLMDL